MNTKNMEGEFSLRCTYCYNDIANLQIVCAECEDIQLCLQCFSYGAEIGKHVRTHSYKLMGDSSLFKSNSLKWKAGDELHLLSAIEKYGYGSWKEIAKSLRKELSAEDVKQHYNEIYVHGSIGKATWPRGSLKITDICPENGMLSSSLKSSSLDIPLEYQQQLVYLPFRDDYEKEYDNDAESLVSDIVFRPEDSDIERELKLAQIRMYNDRLKNRFFLKKIVKEHNKIRDFFHAENKPKPYLYKRKYPENCKSYEEFREKMRLFTRFYTRSELWHFYESLQRERELKQRVHVLIKLRKHGCRTVEVTSQFAYFKGLTKKRRKSERSSALRRNFQRIEGE